LVAVQKDLAKARAVQAAKTRGPWPAPRLDPFAEASCLRQVLQKRRSR